MAKKVKKYDGEEVILKENSVLIDPQKFRKLIHAKNLNANYMSIELGYRPTAVKNGIYRGVFSNFMVKAIEMRYGIKYEDYAYIEPTEETVIQNPVQEAEQQQMAKDKPESMAEIYNIVKAAVMDGMTEAIAGSLKNIRGAIYSGMFIAIANTRKEAGNDDIR